MYTASEVLRQKGVEVLVIEPGATVLDAAHLMNEKRVGSLLVCSGEITAQGAPADGLAGILTERDLLVRVIAKELNPAVTKVEDVMTKNVLTCKPATPLEEIRQVMREKRIRHLPVIDGGWIVGVLSIGDLNVAETAVLSQTIETLETYIHG